MDADGEDVTVGLFSIHSYSDPGGPGGKSVREKG